MPITVGISAIGLNVLSEGNSNPMLEISTFLIFPTSSPIKETLAPVPTVEAIDTT